jgi:hypothetical protein
MTQGVRGVVGIQAPAKRSFREGLVVVLQHSVADRNDAHSIGSLGAGSAGVPFRTIANTKEQEPFSETRQFHDFMGFRPRRSFPSLEHPGLTHSLCASVAISSVGSSSEAPGFDGSAARVLPHPQAATGVCSTAEAGRPTKPEAPSARGPSSGR